MTNRLYVENLPPSATETSLRELFSASGSVLEVKMMVDPSTGISRGRAFVTMATPDVAATAMRSFHSHSLGGRNIAVTEARPPAENPVGLIGHGFDTGISQNQPPRSNGNHNGKPNRNHQQRRRRR
jgi:RNA recognition motif-containing protein